MHRSDLPLLAVPLYKNIRCFLRYLQRFYRYLNLISKYNMLKFDSDFIENCFAWDTDHDKHSLIIKMLLFFHPLKILRKSVQNKLDHVHWCLLLQDYVCKLAAAIQKFVLLGTESKINYTVTLSVVTLQVIAHLNILVENVLNFLSLALKKVITESQRKTGHCFMEGCLA